MSEGERQKNKRLLKEYEMLALRKKGEELLAVLPQGEGSGLDADTVDGLHAEQIIVEALERIGIKKGQPTFGGGGMTVHGNEMHAPNFHAVGDIFVDAQYPNALLLSGIRPMTGNLKVLDVLPVYHDQADLGSETKAFDSVFIRGQLRCTGIIPFPGDIFVGINQGIEIYNDRIHVNNIAPKSGVVIDINIGGLEVRETGCKTNIIDPIGANGVTVDGVLCKDNDVEVDQVRTNNLSEKTVGASTTIPRAGMITFRANKTLSVGAISLAYTERTQTKAIPVQDGAVTRYIKLYDDPP